MMAAAALALVASCGDKGSTPAAAAAAAQRDAGEAQAASAAQVQGKEEREQEELVACAAGHITAEPPRIEDLEFLQDQMRCLEGHLSFAKDAPNWREAYTERARIMRASMAIIKALNSLDAARISGGISDPVKTQQILMDRERLKKLQLENHGYVKRAIEEITISVFHALFAILQEGGMKMGDPRPDFDWGNAKARSMGTWTSTLVESRSSGQFLVSQMMTDRSAMFLINGYGPVWIHAYIKDETFEQSGTFSEECLVVVMMTQTRHEYGCNEFLSGRLNSRFGEAFKADLQDDMARKAGVATQAGVVNQAGNQASR